MTKEMYVSSTPHETKVAVTEDDQLAEIFFERENEYTLAGSIYKGRVTRVLPGMQSAFVDIGLERDAFLYVSDFLELDEDDEDGEFEQIPIPRPEAYVSNAPVETPHQFEFVRPRAESRDFAAQDEGGDAEAQSFEGDESGQSEGGGDESDRGEGQQDRGFRGRRRRRMRRGRGFSEAKFDHSGDQGGFHSDYNEREAEPSSSEDKTFASPLDYSPIVLPGESISKYQRAEVPPAVQREQGLDEPEGEAEEEATSENLETTHLEQNDVVAEVSVAETAKEPQAKAHAEPETTPSEADESREPQFKPNRAHVAEGGSFVLPGESIAKYHGEREEESESKAKPETAPAAPVKKRFSHPLPESVKTRPEPVIPEPTADTFHPFVLPGESLSKYREKPARTEVAVREPRNEALLERKNETRFERRSDESPAEQTSGADASFVETEAAFVIESDPLGVGDEPVAEAQPSELAQPLATGDGHEAAAITENPSVQVESEERTEPEATVAGHELREEISEPTPVEDTIAAQAGETGETAPEGSGEQSRASSAFTPEIPIGHSFTEELATESDAAAQHAAQETEGFGADQTAAASSEENAPPPRHQFAPGEGDLEQEEIEGEETEVGHYMEDELEDYEELEEEHFEPMLARGQYDRDELTSAIEETDEEQEAMAASYPDEEHIGDTELEEEESGEEESDSRAEHRGPEVRAPYQQRSPRPAPFDRGRRGRRGGRRMQRTGAPARHESPRQQVLISDLLKEGQEVLVQIAKEPIGKKGARITSHIALPGRFLVYMPTVNHIGVSRKINDDEERMRLKRIMISEREGGHGGFIVRTAAEGVGEDELRADIRFLKNLWAEIKQRSENSKAPALIYHDLNLVERVLRDQVTSDFSQVWVDTESEYERIVRFANRFQPALMRKVKLYTKEMPLFEQFNIQEEINKSLKSKVWLKSGGYIVINQTEALVAIDVNTGKYVGKTARLEDTIVKTNVDAIKEIVRQIRLRDLGGIIVVDFIDMDERKNRQKVMQALSEAMKSDRAPSKVLAFNDFGLVAITRKRVKQSLERTLGTPCSYCSGTGFTKSVITICNEIYVEMKKMARHLEHGEVLLRVNPEVAQTLKGNGGHWLQELEELTKRTVIVKSDPLLHQEQFDIH
jgi:Rne/Rng family ribonuclease